MKPYSAFTLRSNAILDRLETDVSISSNIRDFSKPIDKNKHWKGLWDTGASRSSIDKRIADELKLIPVGMSKISTANGIISVNTYFVDLTLPNHVTIQNVLVTGADLGKDIDLLIGMDIIRHGDFIITNTNNSTTFSFRIPSIIEIDYVQEYDNQNNN